jgi:Reverse transcriptase (RNA-dependent DNA polymerase)
MTATLCENLGKICHIYLDDIIVWSDMIAEHIKHIDMVMKSLCDAHLYCNPNKCRFFKKEVDFLGHHISAHRIKANSLKMEKIINWPLPKSTTNVFSFLGLLHYIALFLPRLADYTCVLTPLTTKDAWKCFPECTLTHQTVFEAIKALVVSPECLTTIDHKQPGDIKIFTLSSPQLTKQCSGADTWGRYHTVYLFDL